MSSDVAAAIEPRFHTRRVCGLGRVADFCGEDHYQAFCRYAAWRAYSTRDRLFPMSKTEDKISGGYTRRGSRHDTVVKGRSIASPVCDYEVLRAAPLRQS